MTTRGEPEPKMRFWHYSRMWAVVPVWVAAVVPVLALIDRGIVDDRILVVVLLAVMAGGLVATFYASKADEAAFWERTHPPAPEDHTENPRRASSSRDDSGPHYWATGGYDPERYGNFVRNHSPEEREYIRDAYGDLDTWESNRPD
ncbi:hypothetical protein ACFQ0K_07255 [Nocardioides caeni]|uniref:Uncharacterized protein n=1 Tax=Nocardioides caeni TaxID=574700 RepID=A0A4S8MZU6_9ACTN|nr:hypothetical protein [Nocardioides caeni]THV08875.1 hypothetical protein E9934_18530 [Nocardioides caeni]